MVLGEVLGARVELGAWGLFAVGLGARGLFITTAFFIRVLLLHF